MHDDEVDVDEALVARLLTDQCPELASQPPRVVEPWGTDHAIWRIGDDHVVRLPRIHWAKGQPEKEATWLPILARHLPVAVPQPVAIGKPSLGYPFPWTIHRWLPGDPATLDTLGDPIAFARQLAQVLRSLQSIPTDGAPEPHNRARPLEAYDAATRDAIRGARHLIDADAALAFWEDALAAPVHAGPLAWVQGDLEGNCLVDGGRLCGIVDWGSECRGDPAVDVQVIWSPLFTEASRQVLLDDLEIDDATYRRSRGAAINQACAAVPYYLDTYPEIVERSWHKLAALGIDTTA